MGQSTETLIRGSTGRYLLDQMPEQRVPTPRPAPRYFMRHPASTGGDALEPVGAMSGTSLEPIPLVDVVIKLLDRAAEAMDSDGAAAKDCIARATALLQTDHDRADRASCGTSTLARGGLAPWQVRQVTKHIDQVLASTIRTQECAKVARLSTSHFRRAFKVSFGVTFYKYINRRRVERAQEMMVMTDQPLCQIARQCGFADQPHFTRVFRRLVGSSPAIWRRL
jgi:AraC family transcriptional regulator